MPILLLILSLKKIDNFKGFYNVFTQAFNKAILLPLLLIISTWILYGLFIYPREVHANMNMGSSADLSSLRNTISTEYLKENELILDENSDTTKYKTKYKTKSKALVDQCFNEKGIAELFKALREKEQETPLGLKETITDLEDGVAERIRERLQTIARYEEFQKNYCSADEYQLVYRIAYIVRNKPNFQLNNIFQQMWLKKFNKESCKANKITQKKLKEYFFAQISANDQNQIEQKYENAKGAGNSIMSGGQIIKYFAKVSRFFIVTLVFGQVYKFLDEAIELLKEIDIEFLQKILGNKIKSKVSMEVIKFTISIIIFLGLYCIFEKFMNTITQAHAISIVWKLNSDSGYVFGINKKENQQLMMDSRQKNNEGEDRELTFDDDKAESAISYRILLNLAIHPLLDINAKDEFYISS